MKLGDTSYAFIEGGQLSGYQREDRVVVIVEGERLVTGRG